MTDFVYFNIVDPGYESDLFISMLSVETHFQGDANFWVVGDIPEWYTGNAIPLPKITKEEANLITKNHFHHRYCDQMRKVLAILNCSVA